jgi:hypothetical protein
MGLIASNETWGQREVAPKLLRLTIKEATPSAPAPRILLCDHQG